MPNRPMTAIRKLKPRSNSLVPKVMRRVPVTESSPTAASAKPSIMAVMVLAGALAEADEAAKGEQLHGEEFRRPELQREFRHHRREKRDHDHRNQGTDER